MFAIGRDRTLQHIWQERVSGSTAWSGWHTLTGPATKMPAVVLSVDARMEVFVPSVNDELRHLWQSAPSSAFSPPGSLGGQMASPPAASRNGDGRLEAFHIGIDRRLYNNWQLSPNNGFSGRQARELGSLEGRLCAARNADYRLEVFALDDIGNMWHMWQSAEPVNKNETAGSRV